MYLIDKGGKDHIFDIEGWQRLELTCAPQGCRRSDGKTWPRCPEPRRQVTCKLAKISDKVFVGKNLFKVFLSLDFHFYCKINWNTASYFRKVSGVLPVLAKLTPLPLQRILFLRPDLSNFSSLWGSILGSEVYDVFLTPFVDILRRRILLDWPIKHPSDPMFISPPLLLRRCMLPLAIKITGKLNFPRSALPQLSLWDDHVVWNPGTKWPS